MKLAPVLIATHTRLDHLSKTVAALQMSDLAGLTELFIVSDAGRNDQEMKQVEVVRSYIDSIKGFKRLTKINRAENYGHFDNFQDATNLVFSSNEKIIKLEDDIITSPLFLKYMNDALDFYENDSRVVAVSGHLWDGFEFCGNDSTALLPAANCWGWGTWKNKFYKIDHSPKLHELFLKKSSLFWKMNLMNPRLLGMVHASYRGELKAGDVNWMLNLILNNQLVLYPRKSLVRNIGFDGSGQNCNINPSLAKQIINLSIPVAVYKLDELGIKNNKRALFKYFGGYKQLAFQLLIFYIKKYFGDNTLNTIIKIKKYFK